GSDQSATIGSWGDTSISVTVPSGIADNDDACDVKVTRAVGTGSKTDVSTNFVVLPDVTGLSVCTDCVINGAREHASGVDTDGIIMLNGVHLGTAQGVNGKVEFTGGFGTVNAPIHGTAEGACASAGWAAAGTSVCVEVSPSISDSVYTGTITLTRNDLKTNVWADFRVLPRITSNSPTSGIIADVIQLLGNHFCQSGTCPVSPNRSSASDHAKFGSTQAADGDFMAQSGGAGACNGSGVGWTHAEICLKVPAGTPVGSQATKVRSGAGACPGATCYESNIKGFTVLSTVPDDLTNPLQYKSNGSTLIPVGTGTNETTVVYKASMSAQINSTLCLQVENAAVATAFAGTVTAQEGGGGQEACKSYTGTPVTGVVTITGLADGTSFHWRARVKNNSTGETSNWVSYDPGAIQNENPPTNPASTDYYVDASGPVISSVCTVNPAASSCDGTSPTDIEAQIRWTTNESANEQVAYGTTCPTGQASAAATFTALTSKKPASPSGSGTTHTQTLTGLSAAATYQFMVRSADGLGNVTYEPSTANTCNNFTTSAATTRIMKTNEYFIQTSRTTTLSNDYPKTFSIWIPESNTARSNVTLKSVMIEISGLTVGDGGGNISINPNVNGAGATSYALADPGAGTAVSWTLAHPLASINYDCPSCTSSTNTLDITVTGGGTSTIVTSKAIVTYFYTP
ncbi:MAG: hypothetical protein AAB692_01800, partial [Patescibacteria group bacterium]